MPCAGRQLRLRGADLRHPEVVVPEVGRLVGLLMTAEARCRPGDVDPIGEARPPPLVVLGGRVELREVEGDGAHGIGARHPSTAALTRSRVACMLRALVWPRAFPMIFQ